MSRFKYGEQVIFDDVPYEYISSNPDGSYNLRRYGSKEIIAAPSSKVFSYLREGREDNRKPLLK